MLGIFILEVSLLLAKTRGLPSGLSLSHRAYLVLVTLSCCELLHRRWDFMRIQRIAVPDFSCHKRKHDNYSGMKGVVFIILNKEERKSIYLYSNSSPTALRQS